MLMRVFRLLPLVFVLVPFVQQAVYSQSINVNRYASVETKYVELAKQIVADSVFARLENEEPDELAEWIVNQTGYMLDGAERLQKINEFRTQFGTILLPPPEGPVGAIEGYELLQEDSLPSSDRYFRLVYLSHHQRAPLIWEYHFYITSTGEVLLNLFLFNGGNPFDYLSTSDMLLNQYYNTY